MSKAVRWQVPFSAQDGTKYRVDIYDEGYTGSPVQLTAGETPFTTDEDDSDDFFAPVRTQSGTLQICTETPSGSTIKLEDILPANNIERPVRLVNLSNSNAVEWQGFLSCEAYSQDYIGIPQNLDLPLIGVLEAMDSVHATTSRYSGAMNVRSIIYNTLQQLSDECGLTMVTYVVYSYESWRILDKYIDTDLFFETKEQLNENTVTYILEGMSCKEILNKICTFMGWTLREHGTRVYFQRIGEKLGMYEQSLSSLTSSDWSKSRTFVRNTDANMDNLEWRGTGHEISKAQGGKSVSVVASLSDYDADMNLPDYMGSEPTSMNTKIVDDWNGGKPVYKYIDNVIEQNEQSNNICEFGYHYGKYYNSESGYQVEYLGASTKAEFISHAFLRQGSGATFHLKAVDSTEQVTHYAGAAFIRYADKSSQDETPDKYNQGLYCVFLQGVFWPLVDANSLRPIFTIKNINPVSFPVGKIHITSEMIFLGVTANNKWLDYASWVTSTKHGVMDKEFHMYIKLKIGNLWYNGTDWTTSENVIDIEITDGGIDYYVNIPRNLSGMMEMSIMPGCFSRQDVFKNESVIFEAILKSLDISVEPARGIYNLDRKENNFLSILGTKFRDALQISTDLASFCNNVPSPSLVIDDPTSTSDKRYMRQLGYQYNMTLTTYRNRRPELDLLNRMEQFYSEARQRLELEVEHPTYAPLPLLRLNGINDGKVYLPMAESRDWRTGVCKLTCIECPQ